MALFGTSLWALRDQPAPPLFSRRFWGGALGFSRWLLLRPRGRRELAAMLDDGLPQQLREPMEFLLGAELSVADAAVRGHIEAVRRRLLLSVESVEAWTTDARRGADAQEPAADITPRSVPLRYVAAVGSIVPYWGCFLLLCAKALNARAVLELGSCAGISSSYLAAAPTCAWFATIEGSRALSRLAAEHLAAVNPSARVINRTFDDGLDELLPALPGPLDLVFVDGEHTARAQQRYFDRLWPRLREGGVLLFDDIRWDRDVLEGWRLLAHTPGLACAVDLGRLGLCVRGSALAKPLVFDFSRFTTFWLPRAPAPPRD
jgi:predicted O-methyltransferase YrrM